MANYEIHMPESTSPGDCLGTFGTALSAIGIELGSRINEGMSATYGRDWMEKLEDIRYHEAQRKGKSYKRSYSPYDFNWIINEPYFNQQSPVAQFLPTTAYNFFKNARDLVDTRNRWYHDHNPHNINDLVKALELCSYISLKCELSVAEEIEAVRQRALALRAGSYKSPTHVPSPTPTGSGSSADSVKPQIQRAVGAVWIGGLPNRKIELKDSGALVDEVKKANVLAELTPLQQERYLKLWQLLKPGWLWVDELGQVAAYIQGVLRCVGFWGIEEEPAQDPFSKFLLPHSYELTPDQLIDRETGSTLNELHLGLVTSSTLKRARIELSDNQLVRVTWDGDLIYFGDAGAEYFGEVESQDWFPGHFAVSTASGSE